MEFTQQMYLGVLASISDSALIGKEALERTTRESNVIGAFLVNYIHRWQGT